MRWLALFLLAIAVALLVVHGAFVQHWLAVHLGIVNEGGPYYGWWSGAGSDVGELTLITAVVGIYRQHNCGAPRCFRLGKHPTADGMHKLCHRHHPDLDGHKRTLAEIHQAHREARQ